MGGDSQPQIVAQLVSRVLVSGESVREAVAAPRWRLHPGDVGFGTWSGDHEVDVELELDAPESWSAGLVERGHLAARVAAGGSFGHAHLIEIDDEGHATGAAESRVDSGTVGTVPN